MGTCVARGHALLSVGVVVVVVVVEIVARLNCFHVPDGTMSTCTRVRTRVCAYATLFSKPVTTKILPF